MTCQHPDLGTWHYLFSEFYSDFSIPNDEQKFSLCSFRISLTKMNHIHLGDLTVCQSLTCFEHKCIFSLTCVRHWIPRCFRNDICSVSELSRLTHRLIRWLRSDPPSLRIDYTGMWSFDLIVSCNMFNCRPEILPEEDLSRRRPLVHQNTIRYLQIQRYNLVGRHASGKTLWRRDSLQDQGQMPYSFFTNTTKAVETVPQ